MTEFGLSASGLRAAGSIVAARAYHDTHTDTLVLTHHDGSNPSSAGSREPADVAARVAEVIAATRAIVLGPNR